MSNVDRLFKDKLENHSIPPASQSWEKLESRISKKNNTAVVLRIAAGILLAGFLVTIIVNQAYRDDAADVASKTTNKVVVPPVADQKELTPSADVITVQPTQEAAPQPITSTRHQRTENKIVRPEATVAPESVVLIPEQQLVAEVQPQAVPQKRMVLVYSLPTIDKKIEPAPTTPVEEKRTGLQKVMDVAMEVKSGDSPLGQLREAKDELFALDFRKDKNKDTNN
jgi:hypothetical protein